MTLCYLMRERRQKWSVDVSMLTEYWAECFVELQIRALKMTKILAITIIINEN